MAWHGGSQFAHPTHFRPMDRNSRRVWSGQLQLAKARRHITGQTKAVGEALLQHHSQSGRCDPSHARLAEVAGCCERTVRNALEKLASLGLVTWTRRLMRTAKGSRQTSSAYRLMLANIAEAARRMAKSPGGKICRGTHPFGISEKEEAAQQATREAAETILREHTPAQDRAAWIRNRMATLFAARKAER